MDPTSNLQDILLLHRRGPQIPTGPNQFLLDIATFLTDLRNDCTIRICLEVFQSSNMTI